MLYHLRGIDIDLEQDPYEMIAGPEDRDEKKIALLTTINAPNDAKAIKGIRKKLVKEWYKGDILTDKSLKGLLERAKFAHPDIADDIASGKGSQFKIFENAGHIPNFENKDEFNRLAIDFFQGEAQ